MFLKKRKKTYIVGPKIWGSLFILVPQFKQSIFFFKKKESTFIILKMSIGRGNTKFTI